MRYGTLVNNRNIHLQGCIPISWQLERHLYNSHKSLTVSYFEGEACGYIFLDEQKWFRLFGQFGGRIKVEPGTHYAA